MVDLVNTVETIYSVSGLEDSLSRIERITAAEQRLAAQSAGLANATSSLDRSTLSAARGLDSFTRSMDPLSKATSVYERGLTAANRATAQGIPLTQENARALANAKARVDELSHAVTGSASAHAAHAGANKLNTAQLAEFGHIARSITDELAAGMGPMQAFRLEGPASLRLSAKVRVARPAPSRRSAPASSAPRRPRWGSSTRSPSPALRWPFSVPLL